MIVYLNPCDTCLFQRVLDGHKICIRFPPLPGYRYPPAERGDCGEYEKHKDSKEKEDE